MKTEKHRGRLRAAVRANTKVAIDIRANENDRVIGLMFCGIRSQY